MATIESNDGNTSSIGVINVAVRTVATPSMKDAKKREASSPLFEDLTQKGLNIFLERKTVTVTFSANLTIHRLTHANTGR